MPQSRFEIAIRSVNKRRLARRGRVVNQYFDTDFVHVDTFSTPMLHADWPVGGH